MRALRLYRPRWPRSIILASTALQVVALVWLVLMINIWFFSNNFRTDLTGDQRFSLSPETIQVLKDLREPVQVLIAEFLPQNRDGIIRARVLNRANRVCYEFEKYNPLFTTKTYCKIAQDPEQWKQLQSEFGITEPNCVYFISDRSRVRIPIDQLAKFNEFREEDLLAEAALLEERVVEVLASSLVRIINPQSTKVAFISENAGEREPVGAFLRDLYERGYQVDELDLRYVDQIDPSYEICLYSAQVDSPLTASSYTKIDAFLEAGGRGLFLLGGRVDANYESLLAKWGVSVPPSFIVDMSEGRVGPETPSRQFLIGRFNGDHPITQNYAYSPGSQFEVANCRALRVNSTDAVALAGTSNQSWLELSPIIQRDPNDAPGPFAMASALKRGETKVVVLGANSLLRNTLYKASGQQFVRNAISWLHTEDPNWEGAQSRPHVLKKLKISQENQLPFFLGVLGLFPACPLLVGLVVWLLRRLL